MVAALIPARSRSDMTRPVVSVVALRTPRDPLLNKILRRCGAYYHGSELFCQEMFKLRLISIGFRILRIEKLPLHNVWDIRVCCSLAAQTYLLVSKPVSKRHFGTTEVLLKQFRTEIQELAREMGPRIKADFITVARTGKAYLQASFIWPMGTPGLLLKEERKPEAFSFEIKPWLRRNRN